MISSKKTAFWEFISVILHLIFFGVPEKLYVFAITSLVMVSNKFPEESYDLHSHASVVPLSELLYQRSKDKDDNHLSADVGVNSK